MIPDHILIIGFGGPRESKEIQPFLEEVTRGRRIPPDRLREVARHYEVIGGYSPYNEHTFALVNALKQWWASRQPDLPPLPIFVGMRNWHPFLKEVLTEIRQRGLSQGIGFVLAAHRSEASFERYLTSLEQAKSDAAAEKVTYTIAGPWFRHPLYIDAQTEQVLAAMKQHGMDDFSNTYVLFSAHSIPHEMAESSNYAEEFETSASLVARNLRLAEWGIAYQSRSGSPRDPWLEPDVAKYLPAIQAKGYKRVFIIPIGFLCDNAEVLFDLDVELQEKSRNMGIEYVRASTVMDHPKFVAMVGSVIEETLQQSQPAKESPRSKSR